MSRSVRFDNPAFEPDDDARSVRSSKSVRSQASLSSKTYDDMSFSGDEAGDGSEDGSTSAVSYLSLVDDVPELDYSTLNAGKEINYLAYYRQGPAPPSDGNTIMTLPNASLQKTTSEDAFEVLQSKLEVDANDPGADMAGADTAAISKAACDALISYFVEKSSEGEYARLDFKYIDNLLTGEGAADVNSVDCYGQTVMHEVAREWHTDVAEFLLHHGVDIDIPDNYGRTPLFVAISSDYVKMVSWLIDHGANAHHRTIKGEGQEPIHCAAKYNSVHSLELLVERGCNPDARDDAFRSPLYIAAEYGRPETCRLLLTLELPVSAYSVTEESCLNQIVLRMSSDIALLALDQLVEVDLTRKRTMYYLSHLERKRGKRINLTRDTSGSSGAMNVLEIITDQEDLDLIMHPVVNQLILKKAENYGDRHTMIRVITYVLFVILWTLIVCLRKDIKYADPKNDPINYAKRFDDMTLEITVGTLHIIGQLMAWYFAFKLISDFLCTKSELARFVEWKAKEIEHFMQYAHPTWPVEQSYFENERDALANYSMSNWLDTWRIIEIVSIVSITVYSGIVIAITITYSEFLNNLQVYYSCVLIMVIWLSLNRSVMFLQSLGPFINILGSTIHTVLQFSFLFFEFFIPFVCAIWCEFGNDRPDLAQMKEDGDISYSYQTFYDTVYQVFLMTLVYNYDYDSLVAVDEIMAQILSGLYLLLVACVCINLYIALLSEAFVRIFSTASSSAYINQARNLISIEKRYSTTKQQFQDKCYHEYTPLVVDGIVDMNQSEGAKEALKNSKKLVVDYTMQLLNMNKDIKNIKENVQTINSLIQTYDEERGEEANMIPKILAKALKKKDSVMPSTMHDTVTDVWQKWQDGEISVQTMREGLQQTAEITRERIRHIGSQEQRDEIQGLVTAQYEQRIPAHVRNHISRRYNQAVSGTQLISERFAQAQAVMERLRTERREEESQEPVLRRSRSENDLRDTRSVRSGVHSVRSSRSNAASRRT